MHKLLLFFLLLFMCKAYTQERPIEIVSEKKANRLMLYAINKNEQDFDIMITVKGTNFRQSKGRPRLIRLPGASKVHLKNLIIERGKNPYYTYDLVVNDSLSRRALKKEYEPIKIHPQRLIIVYIPEDCLNCTQLTDSLSTGKYLFNKIELVDKPEMHDDLRNVLNGTSTPFDSIREPFVSLGGRIYMNLNNYSELLEELKNDKSK